MTIDKYQTNDGSSKNQPFSPRPQLGISAKNDSNNQATDDRILSNLTSEPITKQSKVGSTNRPSTKLFPLLGIATIAAFLGYQYLSNPVSNNTASGAPDHSVTPTTPSVLAAAQPVASAPAMEASTTPEAAQIINTPNPAVANLPAMAADTLTRTLEDGVAPPMATLERALTTKVQPTAQLETKISKPPPATKSPPSPVTIAALLPAKASPPPKPVPAVAAADQDVKLLAALIAHSETAAAPPPQPSASVAAKPKDMPKADKKLEKGKQQQE